MNSFIAILNPCIDCKEQTIQEFFIAMHPAQGPVDFVAGKDYIEERAIEIANYIIEERTIVIVI